MSARGGALGQTPAETRDDKAWRCPACGHEMWAEFTGTVEFSVVIGCPGCQTVMDRLDPLGEIEREARGGSEPVSDVLAEARRRYE